ncbi:MAG: L-seryl-tRNA(Sec) selenium transferase [Thermodesulfobacteriota bacterium]
MEPRQDLLRRLPKVDQLLEVPEIADLSAGIPRRLILKAIREHLDDLRGRILDDPDQIGGDELDRGRIVAEIAGRTLALNRPSFRRVVNATGVVVHTNLGRSLMADEALAAVHLAGRYYSNLEFDLAAGRRGSRYSHVEGLLHDLTGAEAGLVVNNNAAAVLLTLNTLAAGKEVIVSRGELVEIGGSFRVPEVMARSGSVLVEVGTTNKTRLSDYEQAITERTALLLKVHQSNFRIEGFTEAVEAADLAALGRKLSLPVMEDLGSGSLVNLSAFGLRREPTVQETVAAGMDVTSFSGDKLLGGPQAGIIVGRREIISLIKKNPLNRALRIDKFTLAALEATLRLYLDEAAALSRVPTLRLITVSYQTLRRRAARLKRNLASAAGTDIEIGLTDGASQIGGGALPTQELKTRLVLLRPKTMSVNHLEEWLRSRPAPIIGRIENEALVLDVRTMDDSDFPIVAQALVELGGGNGK